MTVLNLAKSIRLTDLSCEINRYRYSTPGIYVCLLVPVELSEGKRFVSGLVAVVNHGRLRQCEPSEHGFVGPPNFVLDVFESGERDEYELRREAFGRAGVTEYVAVFVDTSICHWNRHNGTEFELVSPDDQGTLKSKALPGLWFSTSYEAGRSGWTIVSVIDRGVTRVGHHEFMETIFHKGGRDPGWGDWMPFDAS